MDKSWTIFHLYFLECVKAIKWLLSILSWTKSGKDPVVLFSGTI